MAQYDDIKEIIEGAFYTNGLELLNGADTQAALKSVVEALKSHDFAKVITPTDDFTEEPNTNWFWLASESGTYTNFGGVSLDNELAIIKYNGTFTKYKICNMYLPVLPATPAGQYLDDSGSFSTPSGTPTSYLTQSYTSVASVTITHNFGAYPAVQCLDADNEVFIPFAITHTDTNIVVVDFDSTRTGNIILTIGSDNTTSYSVKSANYTFTETDKTIEVDTAGVTITLLTAVGYAGKDYRIINNSIGTITVQGSGGSELIGDNAILTLYPDEVLEVISNGTKNLII